VAGLERRHVRRDALKMARAEQHLEKQPGPKGGLKHQKAGQPKRKKRKMLGFAEFV
jgi:hypothetical protein